MRAASAGRSGRGERRAKYRHDRQMLAGDYKTIRLRILRKLLDK